MAVFDMFRHTASGPSFAGRTLIALNNTLGAISAYRATRATRNALSALDDRALDDIGLARGDIEGVARRTC